MREQINYDSSHRDIKPYWPSPAHNLLVLVNRIGQTAVNGEQSQRNDCNGEHNVRQQNNQINGFHRSFSPIFHICMRIVIHDVRHQKEDRKDQSRNHAGFMCLDIAFPDEKQCQKQQNSDCRIDASIHQGQKRNITHQ